MASEVKHSPEVCMTCKHAGGILVGEEWERAALTIWMTFLLRCYGLSQASRLPPEMSLLHTLLEALEAK